MTAHYDPWLAGKRVIVTAGGTREPIDPVRYIGNRSSGKMGHALAIEARRAGALVTLITAAPRPPDSPGLGVVTVETANQMLTAVRDHLGGAAALFMAAAVADYRPVNVAGRKIKKDSGGLVLRLTETVDILLSLRDDPLRKGVVVVGFAAETDDLVAHARTKLEAKGLDVIVANDVSEPDTGIGSDDNAVTIITRDGNQRDIPRAPKLEIAAAVVAAVRPLLDPSQHCRPIRTAEQR